MSTVLLQNGTVGDVDAIVSVGDEVTVMLHDENGMPVKKTGVVAEVLA